MQEPVMPDAVWTIWTVGLVVTLLVWVPAAVYSLHRTWRAARSIRTYAAEALQAAAGIVQNTAPISALGATIGVAVYPTDGEDATTLLGNADSALDQAKADGRGSIRFFVCRTEARHEETANVARVMQDEIDFGMHTDAVYENWGAAVHAR